jgi:hypothetical protein
MSLKTLILAAGIGLLCGAITGAALTAHLYRPSTARQEAPEPARQVEGGLVAERTVSTPFRPVPGPFKPKQIRRQEQIRIQADPAPAGEAPPPIDLTVTEVTTTTGSRVVISDPAGAHILGALDLPGAPLPARPDPPRYALGALYNGHSWGLYAARTYGPVELHVQVFRGAAAAGIGIRF